MEEISWGYCNSGDERAAPLRLEEIATLITFKKSLFCDERLEIPNPLDKSVEYVISHSKQ